MSETVPVPSFGGTTAEIKVNVWDIDQKNGLSEDGQTLETSAFESSEASQFILSTQRLKLQFLCFPFLVYGFSLCLKPISN